jgi:hypothetical protein
VLRERGEGEFDGKVPAPTTNSFPSHPVPPLGAPPHVMGENKVREEACSDLAVRLQRLTYNPS